MWLSQCVAFLPLIWRLFSFDIFCQSVIQQHSFLYSEKDAHVSFANPVRKYIIQIKMCYSSALKSIINILDKWLHAFSISTEAQL